MVGHGLSAWVEVDCLDAGRRDRGTVLDLVERPGKIKIIIRIN